MGLVGGRPGLRPRAFFVFSRGFRGVKDLGGQKPNDAGDVAHVFHKLFGLTGLLWRTLLLEDGVILEQAGKIKDSFFRREFIAHGLNHQGFPSHSPRRITGS